MNNPIIYLEEKIQHSIDVVYLYILQLPQQQSDYYMIQETIEKKDIRVIYNSGPYDLKFQVDKLLKISEQYSKDQLSIEIEKELFQNKNNVGLICSHKCDQSLRIFFHFMVMKGGKQLHDFHFNKFEPAFTREQLSQYYNQIKKLYINGNIIDTVNISHKQLKITQLNSKSLIKLTNNQMNQHRIFNGYSNTNSAIYENNKSNIKSKVKEQVLDQEDPFFIIPPFVSLADFNNEEVQEYNLPQKIQFSNILPQEGFKCLL